jgi:hypothetical protein
MQKNICILKINYYVIELETRLVSKVYTITVNCAGILTLMIPPNAHTSIESLVNIGPGLAMTVGFVGTQTPAGVGIQGPGVKTPKAAAVKAAVVGLARLMQTPKGATFKNGAISMQVPIGPAAPITIDAGKTVNAPGAAPNGHEVIAPQQTPSPMILLLRIRFLALFKQS